MMWFVIDMVLLLILPFRKTVTKYENVMRRRSIESVKSLGARLMDVLSKIFLLIPRSEERRVGKECRSRWSPYH